MTKINMCGRPSCCPTIELLPDGVSIEIEDDNGDTVQMTKQQWETIRKVTVKDL